MNPTSHNGCRVSTPYLLLRRTLLPGSLPIVVLTHPRTRSSSFSTLILTRHGESEWNQLNLFTGWKDPDLTAKGREEAALGGKLLKEAGYTHLDQAFTSVLQRAQHTLDIQLEQLGLTGQVPITCNQALNERDYGALTGLNKDDARKKWGEDQVHIWRRSYDVPPPDGESLELTGKRVYPYYKEHILPLVEAGKTIIVTAHGNSLRSMIKELENLSGDEIVKRELATGVPYIYKIEDGKVISSEVLKP